MGLNQLIRQGRKQGARTSFSGQTLPQRAMRLGQLALEATGDQRFTSDFEDRRSFPRFQEQLRQLKTESDETVKAALEARDADGKTIAHRLVEKRQIKFVKELMVTFSDRFDVDIEDGRGRTPLATAVALGESEIAACLLVMGSSPQRARNPSSAGLRFNKALYPLLNIDSGRILSREAFARCLDAALDAPYPPDFFARLRDPQQPVSLDDIELLGRLPRLEKISLADGCDAVTSNEIFASLVRTALLIRRRSVEDQGTNTPAEATSFIADARAEPIARQSFGEMLAAEGLDDLKSSRWEVAGRTLFVTRPDGRRLAVKLAKSSEATDPHPLARELVMTQAVSKEVGEMGLQSALPTPIRLTELTDVPTEITDAIAAQAGLGHHHFELADDKAGLLAYLYDAPQDYDRYLSDPTITAEELHVGMQRFIGDFGRCAAHGLFHTAPADFQHDAVSAAGPGRPHLITFESWLAHFRFGAGRIVNWQSGVGTPNARVSGLADLKHLKSLSEASTRYDATHLHAEQELRCSDAEKSLLTEVELLAGGLFAATMIVASSWKGRVDLARSGNTDVQAVPLETELRTIFEGFVQGYLGLDADASSALVQRLALDFDRMGAQIRFFCSTSYVEHANDRPGGDGPAGALARRSLAAIPHLAQGLSFAADRHAIDPRVLENIYGRGPVGDERGRPEVSSAYMKSSVTWNPEKGWTNAHQQENLGPHQGPLALQAMVSAIFSTVYTTLMVASANEGPDSSSSSAVTDHMDPT